MNLFCGGKFSDRVSSEKLLAVSAAGPPAAFFPEIDISGFFGHAHFEETSLLLTFDQNVVAGNPPSDPAGPSGYVYLHCDDQHHIKIAINDTTHITFSSNIVTINPPHDLDADKT